MACTLIVAFYPQSNYPLVIAANRDENPSRPSEPWLNRRVVNSNNTIYCPLDVRGGTWIGCNSMGIFAAITNWDLDKNLHGLKSRGDVVLNILKCNTIKDVLLYWAELNAEDYKPFNIIVGTHDILYNLNNDNELLGIKRLKAGLHISTGIGFNLAVKRDQYIRSELIKDFKSFEEPVSHTTMQRLLSAHNDGDQSEDSVCVHDPEHRWETRSSAVLVLGKELWTIRHNDGPPCKANDDWNKAKLILE